MIRVLIGVGATLYAAFVAIMWSILRAGSRADDHDRGD